MTLGEHPIATLQLFRSSCCRVNSNTENSKHDRALLGHIETLKESEREAREARAYADAVIESIPPFLVLDSSLRVKTANASFCEHFHVSRAQTENCLVYDLGNGQWNIPQLRSFLEQILPRSNFFRDFEVTHEFESIGRRTMLLSGRQVDHLQRILLFINDVTDTLRSQDAMHVSEVRYRRLFEAARDGILILDPDTRRIADANPFMSELLGYKHEDLLGKELWEIGLLKDEEASRTAFRELQNVGFIRYEDLPLQSDKGARREVEFVSNLYQENGHKVIQCNIRDITERKHAEEALRANEERYRTLFNSIDEGFCVIELLFEQNERPVDYRFLEVNPSFEKQSGLRDATGKWVRELIPDLEASWFETLGRVALTGEPVRFVNEARTLKRWFDVYAFRIGDRQNGKLAILFNDITGRKQTDDALAAARDQLASRATQLEAVVAERTARLRESIGELSAYSYSIAHDMRAPLRAMRGYADLLLQHHAANLDAEGLDYLKKINASASRMDTLIQEVLTYTQVAGEKITIAPIDADKLMREVIESYPQLRANQAEFHIEGVLPTVLGNDASLAQCLSNILANAVKFVAPGTKPTVEIRAQNVGCDVKLWIEDNGIGIELKDQQRIFKIFERVNPENDYEGTGIGLAIVRKAAERMGGSVGVQSEIGKGSKFWIQLKRG
jgi:PAS domain S-box-containing protein